MMYGETLGVMFPYLLEPHLFDDFAKPNASPLTLGLPNGFLEPSDYNIGDLFEAPEPMIGESPIGLNPSMFDVISVCPQPLTVSDIETSFENEHLLNECRKVLLAKEDSDTALPADHHQKPFEKSVSSDCLRSLDTVAVVEAPMNPSFLNFPALDFGMRRAFSEGDIKALGNGEISLIPSSSLGQHNFATCSSQDRKEKLSRYRNKRSRRNFGRKIKYACRKALADSQPRIRGRFAKTEGMESFQKQ